MAEAARKDGDMLKRLDELRPAYERLRTEAIRAENDIERLTAELDAAKRVARAELGTDDEAEIRKKIAAARDENAARVDEFGRVLRGIEEKLTLLERDA